MRFVFHLWASTNVRKSTGRLQGCGLEVMTTPITITIPHELGRAEARRRIETGFTKMLRQLAGSGGACSERWDGDRLTFSVAAMGQTVGGILDVLDRSVTMDIELSGVLGKIASIFKGQLQKGGQLLLKRD
jgi:Putative polyhydroxyalkanoic acid system protein (PHA_gran_rgn)